MINTHPKMLDEVLAQINSLHPDNTVSALKSAYTLYPYVRKYIELNVSEIWTSIDIQECIVKDYGYHRSLAGSFLSNRHTWGNIVNILMNPEAKDVSKKKLYTSLSEMLYCEEADILKNVLLKTLSEKYSNLTHEKLSESLN